MKEPFLSVVVPAYNESERLPLTLLDMDRYLSASGFSYEILVVDDGSTDNTVEIVNKMAETIPNLSLISNEKNMGKGAAVRRGMLAVSGEYRLFSDADNSTSLEEFAKTQPFFEENYEVVVGSRALKDAILVPAQPALRRILGRIGNLVIQATNVPGIWDTQCGFKAFTAESAKRIFSLSRVNGWGFDIEVLALARSLGYRIKEVPVRWVNDASSRVGASSYLKVLLENVKIRWWLIIGAYKVESKPKD